MSSKFFTAAIAIIMFAGALIAQNPPPQSVSNPTNYVVGPQDVLFITSYDQNDLSGRFTVQADGTFTFPMIGRFLAGGSTLRQIEARLKKQLVDEGFFKNPQITVSIDTYKSQKINILGEVRSPGTYVLTGDMDIVEALARAGSTTPSATGEAIIVRGAPDKPGTADEGEKIIHIELKQLQDGKLAQNVLLRDNDTIFVPRAETIYVFGQVKNPGAYALQQRNTTVMQALALAGGITDRGSSNRIRITRVVNGKTKDVHVKLTDAVMPGDTIVVSERFF